MPVEEPPTVSIDLPSSKRVGQLPSPNVLVELDGGMQSGVECWRIQSTRMRFQVLCPRDRLRHFHIADRTWLRMIDKVDKQRQRRHEGTLLRQRGLEGRVLDTAAKARFELASPFAEDFISSLIGPQIGEFAVVAACTKSRWIKSIEPLVDSLGLSTGGVIRRAVNVYPLARRVGPGDELKALQKSIVAAPAVEGIPYVRAQRPRLDAARIETQAASMSIVPRAMRS